MDDPIESTLPVPASTVGAHPSFRTVVAPDGTTEYEPTAHYLPNMAAELLNRGATRVDSLRGVKDVLFHYGLEEVGPDGIAVGEGEMAISIVFDSRVADAGLTLLHRVESDGRELQTTERIAGAPFLPTIADVADGIEEALSIADLDNALPFSYLEGVQIGNHLFAKMGDGQGGAGGYFRVVVERIDAEQFALMQDAAGAMGVISVGDEDFFLDDGDEIAASFALQGS